MEDICINEVTISLPCELLRCCLKPSKGCGSWEGESPDVSGTFPISTVLRKDKNVVEFSLSGLSIVCSSQSIHFSVLKAWKSKTKPKIEDIISDTSQNHHPSNDLNIIASQTITETEVENDITVSETHTSILSEEIEKSKKYNTNNEEISDIEKARNLVETCETEKPKPKKQIRKPRTELLGADNVEISGHESGRKRYGLRGVKLSSVVMEAVKGKYQQDECAQDEDINDEDYDETEDEVDSGTKANAEAQTDYDVGDKMGFTEFEKTSFKRKKKSNIRTSLKMFKRFKETYLTSGKETDKNILATIGNVYSKERRKKNIDKNAVCKYCGKGFCDYTGVDTHVKKFHKNKKDVKEYLEELVPLKEVICEICNVKFPSRLHLQVHEDRDHAKTLSQCNVCGKVFKNLQFLRNHLKTIHLCEGKHLCHLCSSEFKHAGSLRQHIEEIHEKKRNVNCSVCGKLFYRQSQLNRHFRIHDSSGKKLVCQTCGRSFNYECNLQRHIKVVHNPRSEKFHCSYCGKGFNQKASMNAHVLKLHYNLCPFVCKICQSPFMRSKQIEDHMAQAHNVTDFKIENPREKLFKYNRTADDLLSCSYCQETFCFKRQLVDHIQTAHMQVFPYHCDQCQHGFLEKNFLLRHQERAHDIEPSPLATNDQKLLHVVSTGNHGNSKRVTVVPLNMTDIQVTHADSNNSNVHNSDLTVDQSETITEMNPENHEDISTAASVLVEISNEDNTIQYVIQGSENIDMDSSDAVVHDIASLLLAAEQSLHENSGSVTLTTVEESGDVAMETNEVNPSVITISNGSDESVDITNIEADQEMVEASQTEEITVIMKE